MKWTLALILLVLFAALTSGCTETSWSGEYTLGSGQTLWGDLVMTSGQATLEPGSKVTGSVIMTSGDLQVEEEAEIWGDVVMFSGDLYLGPRAVLHGNVIRTSGRVHQAEGARLEGQISSNIVGFNIGYLARIIGLYCVLPLVMVGAAIFLVIRRKGGQAVAQASTPAKIQTQKLKELKEMLDNGLIAEADYEAKKDEILLAL